MRDAEIIKKLINHIERINYYCGQDIEKSLQDLKTLEACIFNLSQMGELVKRISADFEETHSDIPWRKLYGLRNKIVHDYEGINKTLILEIIRDDLPDLLLKLKQL